MATLKSIQTHSGQAYINAFIAQEMQIKIFVIFVSV